MLSQWTRVTPHGLRCSPVAHCFGSVSFQLPHQCPLRLLYLLLGVPLLISGVDPCLSRCSMLLSLVAFCHFIYFTAAHWCEPRSPQLSYYCSLGWFSIISCDLLTFTGVSQGHFRCPPSAYWGKVLVVKCVSRMHTWVAPCFPRYITATHLGG